MSSPKSLRIQLALLSFCAFLVTVACGWLRPRATPTPAITCYTVVAPTNPPTPSVTCYKPMVPSPPATPSPIVTCYEAVIPSTTPPPPPAAPQSRQMLLDRLLAEGRFPAAVAQQLRL